MKVNYLKYEGKYIFTSVDGQSMKLSLHEFLEIRNAWDQLGATQELVNALQKAKDLKVVDALVSEDGERRLVFNSQFAKNGNIRGIGPAKHWAACVLDGSWKMDMDELQQACREREAEIEVEFGIDNVIKGAQERYEALGNGTRKDKDEFEMC